jgi:hypothetical protein
MPTRKEYLRRLAADELKGIKLPKAKKRSFSMVAGARSGFPAPSSARPVTKREKELQDIATKQAFLSGVGTAANVPTSFTLGYLNSLMTLGFGDSAFFLANKNAAYNDLEKQIKSHGFKVAKKISDESWEVVNEETKKHSLINPIQTKAIQDGFPKDVLQQVGEWGKFSISPEDQFAYDVGSVFGSVRGISRQLIKLPKLFTSIGPKLGMAWSTSKVGAAYAGVEQLQKKIEGGEVSLKEAHQTAGMFAAFGVGQTMLTGVSNWYQMNKFLKSPAGMKALGLLTRAEGRTYLEAGQQLHKMGQKQAAETFLGLTAKELRSGNVALKGMNVGKENINLANKLVAQRTMTASEWKQVYGKKLEPIFRKLGTAAKNHTQAAKASASMTEHAIAATGKGSPIGAVIPQKDVTYQRIQKLESGLGELIILTQIQIKPSCIMILKLKLRLLLIIKKLSYEQLQNLKASTHPCQKQK